MIRKLTFQDIGAWLDLAKEVEPLFGEMAGTAEFTEAISSCIADSSALCAVNADNDVAGIVALDKGSNEIAWLAVKHKYRGQGYGYQLVDAAIGQLDQTQPITVQTFAPHVDQGASARKLYLHFGFKDDKDGGKNPAGIDTVIMRLG